MLCPNIINHHTAQVNPFAFNRMDQKIISAIQQKLIEAYLLCRTEILPEKDVQEKAHLEFSSFCTDPGSANSQITCNTAIPDAVDETQSSFSDKLERMKSQDIYAISREDLVDINDISIDTSLPIDKRVSSFIKQAKNPYCYLDHGVVVKVSFTGDCSMEDAIRHYIDTMGV